MSEWRLYRSTQPEAIIETVPSGVFSPTAAQRCAPFAHPVPEPKAVKAPVQPPGTTQELRIRQNRGGLGGLAGHGWRSRWCTLGRSSIFWVLQ